MAALPPAPILGSGQLALTTDDDRQVLSAVVEQSIRPYIALEREIIGLPPGPVILVEPSLPACTGRDKGPPACASVDALRQPDAQGFVMGSWDYREETRNALAASFDARNVHSRRLPIDDLADVVLLADRTAARPSTAAADLVVEMSLPAYTTNGFAIVYGQSTRAGRALQGWAFVLSRASGRWITQHAYLLWIRE